MGGFLNRLFMPCSFQIGFLGWSKPSPFHLKNAFFLQRTVLQNSFPDFFTKKKMAIFPDNLSFWPFYCVQRKAPGGFQIIKKMVSTWQIASWLFQNNIFWKTFAGWMELQQFIILKISLPSFVQCMDLFLWNIGSIWIYFLHLGTVQHDHWRYSLQKSIESESFRRLFFEYRDPPFQTDPQKKKQPPSHVAQRKTYLRWRSSFS